MIMQQVAGACLMMLVLWLMCTSTPGGATYVTA